MIPTDKQALCGLAITHKTMDSLIPLEHGIFAAPGAKKCALQALGRRFDGRCTCVVVGGCFPHPFISGVDWLLCRPTGGRMKAGLNYIQGNLKESSSTSD